MGQILHGSATTTEAVRRAIQNSQESLRVLSKRYGINQKTVAKWKKRTSVADLPTGPKDPHSTVLSPEEEAFIVAFRRHTLLPLDDCLYALQPTILHRTCRVLRYTAACTVMGSAVFRRSKAPSRRRRSSKATRSASSISTSPRCRRPRASCACSWPSNALQSSPTPNSTRRRARWSRPSSCAI
nr:IS481 family transposase [Rhizobium sp. P007]